MPDSGHGLKTVLPAPDAEPCGNGSARPYRRAMKTLRKRIVAKHVERAVAVLMAAGFDRAEATNIAQTAYPIS